MIQSRYLVELTYQLEQASEHQRLAHDLAAIPVFLAFFQSEHQSTVLGIWKRLSDKGYQPEDLYPNAIQALRSSQSELLELSIERCYHLFYSRASYALAMQFAEELLRLAEKRGDARSKMIACQHVAATHVARAEYAEGKQYSNAVIELAEQLREDEFVAKAYGSLGLSEFYEGRYAEAMKYFEPQLALVTKMNDKIARASVLGNMSNIYRSTGQLAKALECCTEQYQLSYEVANKSGMAKALAGTASTHGYAREYERAVSYYERALAMWDELGERYGTVSIMGDLISMKGELGYYEEALALGEKVLSLAKEIGHHHGVLSSEINIGGLYLELGDSAQALACFQSALALSEKISYRFGNIYALNLIARTLAEHEPTRLSEAMSAANESGRLARELSIEEFVTRSQLLEAQILASLGEREKAVENIKDILLTEIDPAMIAEAYYRLWKIDGDGTNRTAALSHYNELLASTNRFEYVKRLADLEGRKIPRTAHDLVPAG